MKTSSWHDIFKGLPKKEGFWTFCVRRPAAMHLSTNCSYEIIDVLCAERQLHRSLVRICIQSDNFLVLTESGRLPYHAKR